MIHPGLTWCQCWMAWALAIPRNHQCVCVGSGSQMDYWGLRAFRELELELVAHLNSNIGNNWNDKHIGHTDRWTSSFARFNSSSTFLLPEFGEFVFLLFLFSTERDPNHGCLTSSDCSSSTYPTMVRSSSSSEYTFDDWNRRPTENEGNERRAFKKMLLVGDERRTAIVVRQWW